MRRVRFACCGMLLALWMAPAASQTPALPLCEVPALSRVVFNPEGDRASRSAKLEKIEADLAAASAYDKHLLGALYRLGGSHPAGLVDRKDAGKARPLLAHAALDGNLTAMAASAELELASDDAMAAMVWAQIYAHYSQKLHPNRYRSYQADLINRAFKGLPSGDATTQEIEALVAGFMATYGERIEKGLVAEYETTPSVDGNCTPVHALFPTRLEAPDKPVRLRGGRGMANHLRAPAYDPSLALFWVRVAPSGKVAEAFVVDSLPEASYGKLMLPTVKALQFNAVAQDAPMRDVLMPMSINDDSIRLKD